MSRAILLLPVYAFMAYKGTTVRFLWSPGVLRYTDICSLGTVVWLLDTNPVVTATPSEYRITWARARTHTHTHTHTR
jgi:hypothetical protein